MATNQDWYIFLESVKCLCREVEHRIYSSDFDTLQEFIFRLQPKRTACERIIIGASLALYVNRFVSANVQGNVKWLSSLLKYLIDDAERQLHSVDSTAYSCSISEILIHGSGCVGRRKLVIIWLRSIIFVAGSLHG